MANTPTFEKETSESETPKTPVYRALILAMTSAAALIIIKASGARVSQSANCIFGAEASIRELADFMDCIDDVFTQLGKQSAEIGSIAGNIQDIAKQTNLLALNASIEAARAGGGAPRIAVFFCRPTA